MTKSFIGLAPGGGFHQTLCPKQKDASTQRSPKKYPRFNFTNNWNTCNYKIGFCRIHATFVKYHSPRKAPHPVESNEKFRPKCLWNRPQMSSVKFKNILSSSQFFCTSYGAAQKRLNLTIVIIIRKRSSRSWKMSQVWGKGRGP